MITPHNNTESRTTTKTSLTLQLT